MTLSLEIIIVVTAVIVGWAVWGLVKSQQRSRENQAKLADIRRRLAAKEKSKKP